MSMGTETNATRESLVSNELSLCNVAVEKLFMELSELDDRLILCLRSKGPPLEETKPTESVGVPLANALAQLRVQIYQARDRLRILIDRVEL